MTGSESRPHQNFSWERNLFFFSHVRSPCKCFVICERSCIYLTFYIVSRASWGHTETVADAVSTSCRGTMHTMLECALFHNMKLSGSNVHPNTIYPWINIRHPINVETLLYKCQDTPVHRAHPCPLLPHHFPEQVTSSFIQKHYKFLKSFRTNPTTQHPIFQYLPSAASKAKYFSDPVLFPPHVRGLSLASGGGVYPPEFSGMAAEPLGGSRRNFA